MRSRVLWEKINYCLNYCAELKREGLGLPDCVSEEDILSIDHIVWQIATRTQKRLVDSVQDCLQADEMRNAELQEIRRRRYLEWELERKAIQYEKGDASS